MMSAVLAVGTELTDGQIVNSNASWISERVKALGPRCALHLTVPDDRRAILEAIDLCAARAELIFVTGGLGPTSDDFTRDLVAEWSALPLEFHEPSWTAVQERLNARDYPVKELQRQQCFFPRGSEVLFNPQGTANGFRLRARDRELVVLPGPPHELAAIWNDHVETWLRERFASLDPVITRSWDCVGLGESQVVEIAEPIVAGAPVEVGYRVHLPYVEFKISVPRSRLAENLAMIAAVDAALSPYAIARDGADAAAAFARAVRDEKTLTIEDRVCGPVLLRRLQNAWPEPASAAAPATASGKSWTFSTGPGPSAETDGLKLWLRPLDEHSIRVGLRRDNQTRETVVEAPMRSALMAARRRQHWAELALVQWTRWLLDLNPAEEGLR